MPNESSSRSLIQAFGAIRYFFAPDLTAFYAAAVLFGFVYAGIMLLYSVLARETFPMTFRPLPKLHTDLPMGQPA